MGGLLKPADRDCLLLLCGDHHTVWARTFMVLATFLLTVGPVAGCVGETGERSSAAFKSG